jgi:hypothetical protein
MGSASCAWTPDRHEVSLFADRALAKSGTRPHHSGGGRTDRGIGRLGGGWEKRTAHEVF